MPRRRSWPEVPARSRNPSTPRCPSGSASQASAQQVYRKVKALTGESINEFIRTVRLKRAAQYLAQSDTRISEIMYSVGFNSHSYFTKCFREHFGLSPKEYAEKHRRK